MDNNVFLAFMLTLIAGLCTCIGSYVVLFLKKENKYFLSVSLGFSAGIMIYVSFIEIFRKSGEILTLELGEKLGSTANVIAFFSGMAIVALIDKFVPDEQNLHDFNDEVHLEKVKKNKLLNMGMFTALAVGIHNFPEGLATFMSALYDPGLAVPIVVAIAIHNIPEGIAVAVPIYYATDSKKKALTYSFLSGLSEPLGALIGYMILRPFLSNTLIGLVFSAVGGVMVFISLDKLLPTAKEHGDHHMSIYSLIAGMVVMAISLVLLL